MTILKIKELRDEANLTQKQLADAIGNMQRNVSNWEKGVSEPDLRTVIALADYFGVSVDELCGRAPYPKRETLDSKLIRIISALTVKQKQTLLAMLEAMKEL